MLAAGAETYRIEDTINRMIRSRDVDGPEIFVIPTGIIITYRVDGQEYTKLQRTKTKGIDLEIIKSANEFSRYFTAHPITLEEALVELKKIEGAPQFNKYLTAFASAVGGGFFVPMLGGTMIEMFMAYIGSWTILATTARLQTNPFIKNFLGGMVAATSGVLCVWIASLFGVDASVNKVIIGPLMLLVPGLPLIAGIRDLISGELVAGSARITEAMFIFIAIAFGVGIVLQASILRGIL